MTIRRFEDIEAWQLARLLPREIYALAVSSGLKRDFSLREQILRSTGSIMDNIAEGFDATQSFFEQLYESARVVRAKIGAFIRYLETADRRSSKPKQSQAAKNWNRQPRTNEPFSR